MAPAYIHTVPLDSTHFTPLQLQPRAVLAMSLTGWSGWMQHNLVSLREAIVSYQTGIVVRAVNITYPLPLRFEDADEIEIVTTTTLREDGAVMFGSTDLRAAERLAAQVRFVCRCLTVDPGEALTAMPGTLSPALLDRLSSEDLTPRTALPALRGRAARIARSHPAIATGQYRLTLHRYQCEAADQWSFIEVPTYAAASRENLIFAHDAANPELRVGLRESLCQLEFELNRPYFFGDTIIVTTTAYRLPGTVAFVHRLTSPTDAIHGTVLETF